MDEIDFVFSPEQYEDLKRGYEELLQPTPQNYLFKLNSLINLVETQGFDMPLFLQNKVINLLQQAKQILSITTSENNVQKLDLNNNPFSLISQLGQLAEKLNSHNFKNSFQILYLKTNKLILQAIQEISNYFANKKLKTFKYM